MQGAAMARTLTLLLALTVLVAGCTLIDQTTFNSRAGLGPLPPPVTGPGPTPALITINFESPDPVYEAQLRQAVDDAVSRKPNVALSVPYTAAPASAAQSTPMATPITWAIRLTPPMPPNRGLPKGSW